MKKISKFIILFLMILCFSIPVYAEKGSNDITTAVNNCRKGFNIYWKKVDGAKKYVIFKRYGNGNLIKFKTLDSNVFEFTDTKVKEKQKYFYTVRAFKNNKISVPTDNKGMTRIRIASPGTYKVKYKGITYITDMHNVYPNIKVMVSKNKNFTGKSTFEKIVPVQIYEGYCNFVPSSIISSGNYEGKIYIKFRNAYKYGGKWYYGGWSETKLVNYKSH